MVWNMEGVVQLRRKVRGQAVKNKAVSVHTLQAYGKSTSTVLLILNLGIQMEVSGQPHGLAVPLGKEAPVHIK